MNFKVVLFLAAIPTALAQGERAFNIDFADTELSTNTLHEGGELKFDNVGTYLGNIIDLVVTVVPGTTYTIPKPDRNGFSGLFGQINVQNRPDDPLQNGVGGFDFCFQENGSGASVEIESFDFTVFDLDGRGDRGFEKFTIDPAQYVDFQLSGGQTEIDVQCETTTNPPPCLAGESVVFSSTTVGGGDDNPNDPNNLTPEQLNRSVLFTFREKSCFRASFSQLCKSVGCSVGGNLIFAGSSGGDICPGVLAVKPLANTVQNLPPSELFYGISFGGTEEAPEVSFKVDNPFEENADIYIQYENHIAEGEPGRKDVCEKFPNTPGGNPAASEVTATCWVPVDGSTPFTVVTVYVATTDESVVPSDVTIPECCYEEEELDPLWNKVMYTYAMFCRCPKADTVSRLRGRE
jgi:hypothetical protein